MLPYKIRYVELESHEIFNNIEARRDHQKRKRLGRLPPHMEKFFHNLENSILSEGFRNPILISTLAYAADDGAFQRYKVGDKFERFKKVFLPKKYVNTKDSLVVCYRQGGSRLWVAQKHNMRVPCIASDFCDYFSDKKALTTDSEIKHYFKDSIQKIRYTSSGIMIDWTRHEC